MPKGRKNGKIEFIRFAMAVIVALYHSHLFAPSYEASLIPRGLLAVEFYFILSGYLMMNGCMKRKDAQPENIGRDTQKFIWRKIRTLGPDYWVAYAVAFLMNIPIVQIKTYKGAFKLLGRTLHELTFVSLAGYADLFVNGVDWYISVMLITMLVLYPIVRKWPEHFARVIAPVLAVFSIGIVFKMCGQLNVTTAEGAIGWFYPGLFRGLGEISLGCALWPAIEKIKNTKLTKAGHVAAALTETAGYLGLLLIMHKATDGKFDYAALVCVTIAFCFTIGHKGAFTPAFDNRFVYFLGRLGFDIYLCNVCLRKWFSKWPPADSYRINLVLYMALVFAFALAIRLISMLISKILPAFIKKMKQVLFAPAEA